MSNKVYVKKGNISLKEKAMVRELEKTYARLVEEDPDFVVKTANNPSELEELYNKYTISEAEIEEEVITKPNTKSNKDDANDKFVDPFNRDEPNINEYVLEDDFATENPQQKKTMFDEPMSFDESFTIPESNSINPRDNEKKSKKEASEPQSEEPPNPAFDEMDSAKQRKRTKRFAKQIVALTCDLTEKGFEWYAMKDITEQKLTEYEINNEMDLSLLLDMPDGQQSSVKDFFLSQHKFIRKESIIEQEDRDDLTDALTEVFLEKKIAPTPMQELILVAGRIIAIKTLSAYTIIKSNQSILSQLRGMKSEETGYDNYTAPEEANEPQEEIIDNLNVKSENGIMKSESVNEVVGFEEVMFTQTEAKE